MHKGSGPDGSTGACQLLTKHQLPKTKTMLPKLFQKTRIPTSLSTSFYEASIILKAKQDKIAQENSRQKSLVNTNIKSSARAFPWVQQCRLQASKAGDTGLFPGREAICPVVRPKNKKLKTKILSKILAN